jgi:hypothetical protein
MTWPALTVIRGVNWGWSERANLYNRQTMILTRKANNMHHCRAPSCSPASALFIRCEPQGCWRYKANSMNLPGNEPEFLSHLARSLVNMFSEISRLWGKKWKECLFNEWIFCVEWVCNSEKRNVTDLEGLRKLRDLFLTYYRTSSNLIRTRI